MCFSIAARAFAAIVLRALQLHTSRGSLDKKWCKDSVSTNLDVTSMLGQIPHMDKCPMDPHLA
ncbi:hypothetical protein T06_4438 [Trichinella sp. T6]|nr:hypothetical protein T06_4438 [Trichinella sp. T6]